MTSTEEWLAGKIDRSRAKEQTSARTLRVRELAKATINCAVMEQPEDDRAEFMREGIRHLRTLYGSGEGEAEAVALFGSLAFSKVLQVRGVVAKANAERLFAKAANDDKGGPVRAGDALASALRKLARPELSALADELEGRE